MIVAMGHTMRTEARTALATVDPWDFVIGNV
jgi:hypothetical protein